MVGKVLGAAAVRKLAFSWAKGSCVNTCWKTFTRKEWRIGFKNTVAPLHQRRTNTSPPGTVLSYLLGLCLYVEVVSKMGGTGFVGVGHCPAEPDGSAMATYYLSKCCYLGLALPSGEECELDTLLTHENKEAVKHIVIFIYFYFLFWHQKFCIIFTGCNILLSGLSRGRSKLHAFFHHVIIYLWLSGSYDISFPCCSL